MADGICWFLWSILRKVPFCGQVLLRTFDQTIQSFSEALKRSRPSSTYLSSHLSRYPSQMSLTR